MRILAEQFDYRFISRARKFSIAAGIFAMLVGAVVLSGWLLDIAWLNSIYGDITMKANPAILLVLSGLSLCLLNLDHERRILRIVGEVCAILTIVVAFLTLTEHLIGWNLRIDQLFFIEPPGALATASPVAWVHPPASVLFLPARHCSCFIPAEPSGFLKSWQSVFVCGPCWLLQGMSTRHKNFTRSHITPASPYRLRLLFLCWGWVYWGLGSVLALQPC